ncbi:MAG TPA: dUTP diphosphatase [Rhizomicrobium sp.]|nr:dUTP diphosphatase [Rhizomicrobium sp.]
MRIAIRRLPHSDGLPLPAYATEESAGLDLVAANQTPIRLEPRARAAVPCGFAMALPKGYEGQVRPRSGLALNHGITVLNAPGTIDSDYRGEVKVILVNVGDAPFEIPRGMKIAQLVVARHEHAVLVETTDLPESERGGGGFGSTGLNASRPLS